MKPDAMMTEMIELYKKLVVKVVKEEEDKEEEKRAVHVATADDAKHISLMMIDSFCINI